MKEIVSSVLMACMALISARCIIQAHKEGNTPAVYGWMVAMISQIGWWTT